MPAVHLRVAGHFRCSVALATSALMNQSGPRYVHADECSITVMFGRIGVPFPPPSGSHHRPGPDRCQPRGCTRPGRDRAAPRARSAGPEHRGHPRLAVPARGQVADSSDRLIGNRKHAELRTSDAWMTRCCAALWPTAEHLPRVRRPGGSAPGHPPSRQPVLRGRGTLSPLSRPWEIRPAASPGVVLCRSQPSHTSAADGAGITTRGPLPLKPARRPRPNAVTTRADRHPAACRPGSAALSATRAPLASRARSRLCAVDLGRRRRT